MSVPGPHSRTDAQWRALREQYGASRLFAARYAAATTSEDLLFEMGQALALVTARLMKSVHYQKRGSLLLEFMKFIVPDRYAAHRRRQFRLFLECVMSLREPMRRYLLEALLPEAANTLADEALTYSMAYFAHLLRLSESDKDLLADYCKQILAFFDTSPPLSETDHMKRILDTLERPPKPQEIVQLAVVSNNAWLMLDPHDFLEAVRSHDGKNLVSSLRSANSHRLAT